MSLVKDRRCVVTGKVANHSRQTAQAALREAGAIVQEKVGKDTDVLVTGDAVGKTKINAAKKLGVEIIPWDQAFDERWSGIKNAPARAPMPSVRQWAPMLCKATTELPSGGNWTYEIKHDGWRAVATIKDGEVSIQSRSGKTDLTNQHPQIADELALLPNCVIDGEIATMVGDDETMRFIAFDVLQDGGEDVTKEHLSWRRERLQDIASGGVRVGVSPVFHDGDELLDFVRDNGLEGVVAKRPESLYVEGARNDNWLKIKVRREQEFVVVGHTAGEGKRAAHFGALVLGYYDDSGEMVYAGKCGTGWNEQDLDMLMSLMEPLAYEGWVDGGVYPNTTFPSDLERETTFLVPELVVQIAFQKWTEDGLLWHPSYLRVRDDKEAPDVVRET